MIAAKGHGCCHFLPLGMGGIQRAFDAVGIGEMVTGCRWILSGSRGRNQSTEQKHAGEHYRPYQKTIMG